MVSQGPKPELILCVPLPALLSPFFASHCAIRWEFLQEMENENIWMVSDYWVSRASQRLSDLFLPLNYCGICFLEFKWNSRRFSHVWCIQDSHGEQNWNAVGSPNPSLCFRADPAVPTLLPAGVYVTCSWKPSSVAVSTTQGHLLQPFCIPVIRELVLPGQTQRAICLLLLLMIIYMLESVTMSLYSHFFSRLTSLRSFGLSC